MPPRIPNVIKMFRGIDQHRSKALLSPEYAEDCLNVIISSTGGLEKRKLPVAYTGALGGGIVAGPSEFYNFQQANGTRALVAHFGTFIYTFDSVLNPNPIDNTPSNAGTQFSFVESNNVGLLANGVRMLKILDTVHAPSNWGIVAPVNAPLVVTTKMFLGSADIVNVQRTANVVTVNTVAAHGMLAGDTFAIFPNIPSNTANEAGGAYAVPGGLTGTSSTFDGIYQVLASGGANQFTYTQVGRGNTGVLVPAGAAGIPTTITYAIGGASFRYSYKNSVDSSESSMSPISTVTGNGTFRVFLAGDPPPDTQVDTICWYGSLDAGGTWFLIAEVLIAASIAVPPPLRSLVNPIFDYGTSTPVNLTISGSLINNPPPVGKYLLKWNGRILIINLVGATKQVAYSGYEQILRGRPEQCFPTRNRLVFDIGADELSGGGAYDGGVLFFSKGNRVFRLSGILEDITVSQPLIFTAFLQELSWDNGMLCHWTGASTPYGFVWLASDKSVQMYNGQGTPLCLSEGLEPILRHITPGAELNCIGCYFSYLKRDWYVLAVPTNGSFQPNTILIFDLKAQDNLGTFIFNQPCDWVDVIEDNQSQFRLSVGVNGQIYDLQVGSDTIGGLTPRDEVYSTAGFLTAFWLGGYNGNETPNRMKFLRYGRIITDQDGYTDGNPGFTVDVKLIDDADNTYLNPLVQTFFPKNSGKFSINRAVKRWQTKINFPQADASANLIELQYEYKMGSAR